jgi:hypothetical protein
MKIRKLLFQVCAIAALVLTVGCVGARTGAGGTNSPLVDLQTLSDAVHEAAATGTEIALFEKASTRVYFVATVEHLDALIDAKNFDPAELKAALNRLPIKELKSPIARIVINRGISVFKRYGERIDIDRNTYVAATIHALRSGIQEGLDSWPELEP